MAPNEQKKALINLTEHVNFKAHRKWSLYGVNEYFEHRATQKLARVGSLQSLAKVNLC